MQNFKKYFSKKNLRQIIDFGLMPLGNGFISKKNLNKKEYKFSMKLGYNKFLNLVQLYNNPSPSRMFNKNYAFLSSTSHYMKKHFFNYSLDIKKKINKRNFSVLEIGCNDGILLNNFKKNIHLGVEPSKNVYKLAKNKGLNVINTFFNKNLLTHNSLKEKKFDIICGANVFCHIPNLYEMFYTANKLLDENGIFVIEEPYLGDMILKTSYDQVYDEHIYIFSILSIEKIASFFSLEVFDAEHQITHGGSMRYYLCKKNKKNKSERLKKLILKEKKIGLDNYNKLKQFKSKCTKSRINMLNKIKKYGKINEIYGYAATSKSTTVLNYCKINNTKIKSIFDTSPTKFGKFTPITKIPIVDYNSKFHLYAPKICILFAWNHYVEICKKERKNLKNGMRFICHIDKKFLKKYKKYFI